MLINLGKNAEVPRQKCGGWGRREDRAGEAGVEVLGGASRVIRVGGDSIHPRAPASPSASDRRCLPPTARRRQPLGSTRGLVRQPGDHGATPPSTASSIWSRWGDDHQRPILRPLLLRLGRRRLRRPRRRGQGAGIARRREVGRRPARDSLPCRPVGFCAAGRRRPQKCCKSLPRCDLRSVRVHRSSPARVFPAFPP